MNVRRFPPPPTRPRATAGAPPRRSAWGFLALLAAGAALVAFMNAPAHAQAAARSLVLPATAAENARYALTARKPEPGVVRQRPVGIDLGALDDSLGATPAELRVDLFDSRSLTLAKDTLERRGAGNFTWRGKVQGHPNGFALLTVVNGRISGTIELADVGRGTHVRYQIQSTNDGLTLLREIDPSSFPDDHPGGGEPVAPDATLKSAVRAGADKTVAPDGTVAKADTAATIDVMVVYSNQTAAAVGTGIGAQVQQAIDTANLVYANSGITTRLRLVYAGPANYDESGDFATDLSRLTGTTDGYMDGVHALRDQYGADLVSLFVENPQYCGYGWVGPSAGYAFSVVNRGCASGNYSFPHELGHNFGARHDSYVDPSTTPYTYGHGWVDVGEAWRDVMAYNNACAAVGVSCVRIAYFSTPNLTYGSPADPLGSASTADVVRVHNDNALTVANFRSSGGTVSQPCTYALSPTSASVAAAGGSGSTTLTTAAGCAWNATSSASWLTLSSAASGSGSATVGYVVGSNGGGTRSANLSIGGQTFLVTQAAAPSLAPAVAGVSPSSLGFGTVMVGKVSGAKVATVTNGGGGSLTISSIAMGGVNPGDFAWSGTCAANVALSAGQSCTLSVTFRPLAAGSRSASLSVGTTAGNVGVSLTGSGKKSGRK